VPESDVKAIVRLAAPARARCAFVPPRRVAALLLPIGKPVRAGWRHGKRLDSGAGLRRLMSYAGRVSNQNTYSGSTYVVLWAYGIVGRQM
jgi:hypothetical protein